MNKQIYASCRISRVTFDKSAVSFFGQDAFIRTHNVSDVVGFSFGKRNSNKRRTTDIYTEFRGCAESLALPDLEITQVKTTEVFTLSKKASEGRNIPMSVCSTEKAKMWSNPYGKPPLAEFAKDGNTAQHVAPHCAGSRCVLMRAERSKHLQIMKARGVTNHTSQNMGSKPHCRHSVNVCSKGQGSAQRTLREVPGLLNK